MLQILFLTNMARTNVFIILNLGCEMIYVIDQRLRAQCVAVDKSSQVLRDITNCLLDPKFLQRLMIGSSHQALITPEHCKIILNDIACCSLMRLDVSSMNKLWDLMTMIFKWQLNVAKHPQHLLDITFRHLEGIGQLHSDVKKAILVDYTKNIIVDFWNSHDNDGQMDLFKTISDWFGPLNIKISILIRLGFQFFDGSFNKEPDGSYAEEFLDNVGENIYTKSADIVEKEKKLAHQPTCSKFQNLASELNIKTNMDDEVAQNILLNDIGVGIESELSSETLLKNPEFIKLNTVHNATESSWKNFVNPNKSCTSENLKSLLNTKLP